MALELLLQCKPILKLMSERVRAVHVRPVSAESAQAYDEDVITKVSEESAQAYDDVITKVSKESAQACDEDANTNSEIHFKKEQVIDDTCSRDVNDTSDCTSRAADSSVRTVKSDVCDPATDKDVARNSEADTAVSLEVEGAPEERVSTLDCDCRERREVGQSSSSAVAQGRNETEEELAKQEEESSLVLLLEQRLQFVLRSLTKLCLSKTGGTKKDKE